MINKTKYIMTTILFLLVIENALILKIFYKVETTETTMPEKVWYTQLFGKNDTLTKIYDSVLFHLRVAQIIYTNYSWRATIRENQGKIQIEILYSERLKVSSDNLEQLILISAILDIVVCFLLHLGSGKEEKENGQ